MKFDECMIILQDKLQDMEVTVGNFMTIVKFSMEVVEVTQLKGAEQKEMSIRLVRKVVVDAPISDEKEKLLLDMIDSGVLGGTVDLIVDVSKGNVNINTAIKVATGCCKIFGK
tara:strand:+ start:603 stop:941 length:339 start_codon:yes stop_codon:yes gene_type:complete